MWQGRLLRRLVPVVLALAVAVPPTLAAARSATAAPRAAKSKNTLHQFTGFVTAMDKSSLTVEKRGKKPRTMVFVKHAEMKTTGDVEKDSRVTVYYRDEDGHPVAHRVVVKAETAGG